MRYLRALLVCFVAVGVLLPAWPGAALAAVQGAPDIEAVVVGGNEFQIGSTGQLDVMVQNKGAFEGRVTGADEQVLAYGYAMSGMMVAYPCATAQNLTLTLVSKSPLVEVVGGSMYAGVLPGSSAIPAPISFEIRVYKYAPVGAYDLELQASYDYIRDVDWLNPPDSLPLAPDPDAYNAATYQPQFNFVREARTETIPVVVRVTGSYFETISAVAEGVRPGATGRVTVTLANSGETAYDVTAEVLPGGNFIPVDSSSYLGTVEAGARPKTEFRVGVSQDAIAKTSPLNILVTYRDRQDAPQSCTVNVGLEVEEEIAFSIVRSQLEDALEPGSSSLLAVSLRNDGLDGVQDVIVRINAMDPFTSSDDTAYVGTLAAGATGVARFSISVDDGATPKPYAIDVDVKYKDSAGDSYTSEVMKAEVVVVESNGISLQTMVLLVVGAAGLGAGAYFLARAVSRRRRTPAGVQMAASGSVTVL